MPHNDKSKISGFLSVYAGHNKLNEIFREDEIPFRPSKPLYLVVTPLIGFSFLSRVKHMAAHGKRKWLDCALTWRMVLLCLMLRIRFVAFSIPVWLKEVEITLINFELYYQYYGFGVIHFVHHFCKMFFCSNPQPPILANFENLKEIWLLVFESLPLPFSHPLDNIHLCTCQNDVKKKKRDDPWSKSHP